MDEEAARVIFFVESTAMKTLLIAAVSTRVAAIMITTVTVIRAFSDRVLIMDSFLMPQTSGLLDLYKIL